MHGNALCKFTHSRFQLHGQHRLSHQFHGLGADHMDSQYFSISAVGYDFNRPGQLILGHCQSVDGIRKITHFNLISLVFGFRFGQSDSAHLGNRPYAPGNQLKGKLGSFSHGIFSRNDSHGRRCMAEHPTPNGIPNGIDSADGGFQPVIDLNGAVVLDPDADGL